MGRAITGCTISASPASAGNPAPSVTPVGVFDDNTLSVWTFNLNGDFTDLPFHVQAICPPG